MNEFVALMHRYVYDYTNRQDFSACDQVMEPGYVLHMGTYTLTGRDENYKPATQKQFDQFPGLCLTVNNLITNGDRLLLHFSEHGASVRHDGALAAWSGIGLYRWNGKRLLENYVEQDYYSRRIQLASGQPKAVEASAIAPWDTRPEPADPAAEQVVTEFLENGGDLSAIAGVVCDDAWTGSPLQHVLAPSRARIDDLFSAGDQVAFRITQYGQLLEDFSDGDAALVDREVELHMTGYVTVANGEIAAGRVIRDRLGLYRRLRS